MLDFLFTLLSFVVALGVLIAVHEFGHFWVAKKLGVKVLRFSIGFGKPLWRRLGRDGETEYVIASIPMGGYVKMLDEREGDVDPSEAHRAFNRQPVGRRFAVVAAGPLFNLAFAIFAYWVMFVLGVPGMKAVLGDVEPGSIAAEAGLHSGQVIVAVEGEATPTWGAAMERLIPKVMLKEPLTISIDDNGLAYERRLHFERLNGETSPSVLLEKSGLRPYRPTLPAVIGSVSIGSPAEQAGLQIGDQVISVAGTSIDDWSGLVDTVQLHPGELIPISVRRNGGTYTTEIRPQSIAGDSGPVGRIGVGVQYDEAMFDNLRSELKYGPLEAVGKAVSKTWEMSVLTLRMMFKMLVGDASTENISGPISIAQYAKTSADSGLSHFIGFLAVVSLSLGVLNLLPIPVLDGGHLLYYLIESIKGSPVSEQIEMIGQKIGLAFIIGLMFIAFYNDLARLAG